MSEELKPCPFCGGSVRLVESLKEWAECRNPDCYSNHSRRLMPPAQYRGEVILKWNHRPLESAAEERGRVRGVRQCLEVVEGERYDISYGIWRRLKERLESLLTPAPKEERE